MRFLFACTALVTARLALAQSATSPVVDLDIVANSGRVTITPTGSNSQAVRLTASWPDRWAVSGSMGRSERFGDVSTDIGGTVTRTLRRGFDASLGVATGTGDFIAPRYRIDGSIRTSLLVPNHSLVATASARRIQSKGPNFSTGVAGSLAWYAGHHVLLASEASTDRGSPGATYSPQYAFNATLYTYKRWYLGAGARQGHVAYALIGPTQVLVNYPTRSASLNFSWWRTSTDGVGLDSERFDNDFYTGWNIGARWFHEWR